MSASESPLISVILPAHNAERWIVEAVQSILGQTFGDFELLLVDDHSTDRTAARVRQTCGDDTRLRIVPNEKRGFLHALNYGASLARGRFLARMDGDDVAEDTRFAAQVEYLEKHPNCAALGTRVTCIDADGARLYPASVSARHEDIVDELLYNRPGKICHPTVLMRKDAFERVGGYRQEYHYEDVDLFLRLAQAGRLANLTQPLLRYRLLAKSISRTRDPRQAARIYENIATEAAKALGRPPPEAAHFTGAGTPETPYELHRTWSAAAKAAGYNRSAWKHAFIAFRTRPADSRSWWTLAHAIAGVKFADFLSRNNPFRRNQ